MKSGMTFALLLGVIAGISGAALKTVNWPAANGLLLAGVFVVVIACVFLVLKNAPRQHE